MMQSLILKRSIVLGGRKTSATLEPQFWDGLKEIAKKRDVTLAEMISLIDSSRTHANLSSAIRVYVFNHYRDRNYWHEHDSHAA